MNQIDKLKNLLDQRGVKINWHHYPTPEQVYAQIPEEVLGGVSYDTFKDHFFSDLDKMAEGGTMPEGKDGDVKRSWRKGKKMAVYMGGQWHHFGDSSMDDFRTHKSEKRKEAFYDRHRSALQGDDPRSKAFRIYAKKTWQEGGDMNEVSVPLPNGQEYVFSQDIIEPETGMPFSEVAQRLLMALQNGEIQEAEYAQMIMQLVEANEMAKQQDAAGQMGQQGMMQQPMEQPMGQPMMQQPISGEASMRRGGYLKDKDTYVTKDGRETERGLWANVYLKKKREGMAEGGGMESMGTDRNFRTVQGEDEMEGYEIELPDGFEYEFSPDLIEQRTGRSYAEVAQMIEASYKSGRIDDKQFEKMINELATANENASKTISPRAKQALRCGGYKKMGRNFGGALDPNMVDGGNLVPVSEDATMVQADNPQATDSVETPNAFLDDQEVVVDMPDGRKYVFSQDLKEPETGRSFAELAMELIQMRDAGNIPMEQFNTYIVSLADANDQMREGTPQMAEGGEMPNDMLPYQVWEKYTGTPWSEAKKKGLTDGTEQSNLALKKKILSGEFGQSVQAELPEVTVRAEMPSHIRYKRDFMRENPYDVQGYISKAMSGRKTGRAAYAAIDEKQFLQDLENQYKSNYSKQLSDYVRGRIELETPRGKKDRGEWLDSLTEKERQVIMASDKNQPTYWMEFARSITSLVENNPAQAVMTIMNNKNYSKDEKKAMVMRYMENPAFAKAADAAGVLAPLNIPAKMVQSLYRDDYSLEQALSGVKNDASMLEDIIGDLIFTVGYGAAKSALNLAQRGSVKEAAKVLKEAARQNKGFDAIEEVATQPPLAGSPSRPKGKRANDIGINDPLFDEVMGGMGLPNIGQDIIDDPLRGAAIGDGGLPKIGAEDVRFAPQGSKAIKDVDPENPVVIFKNFLLQREGDKYYKALDNPETVSRMQALDAEYGMNLTDLYEAAKRRWDSGRSLHGNERLKIKNLEEGVEGQSQGPSVRSVIIKKDPQERASEVVRLSDLSKNYINNQVQYSDYPKVVWHELSHDLNKYALETNAAFKADVANVFHKNVRDIDPQALAKAFEGAPKSEIPFYASQDLQYIKQPTEAWAFLSTNLRQELVEKGIFKDYLDTLTPEKLQQVIDSGAEVVNRFSPFIKDKAKFIELFNKMTLATAPIVMDYIYNYEPK